MLLKSLRQKPSGGPAEPPAADVPPPAPDDDPELGRASQWRLVWRKFRRHKLAVAGAVVVLIMHLIPRKPGAAPAH